MHYPFHNREEVLNTPLVKGYRLADVFNQKIVHLTLAPKGKVEPHALPIPVTFYVVSGEGTINIEGKSTANGAGDVIAVEPNLQRSWINSGGDDLVLLVIKSTNI